MKNPKTKSKVSSEEYIFPATLVRKITLYTTYTEKAPTKEHYKNHILGMSDEDIFLSILNTPEWLRRLYNNADTDGHGFLDGFYDYYSFQELYKAIVEYFSTDYIRKWYYKQCGFNVKEVITID